MEKDMWRERLALAMKERKLSMRDVSVKSGKGEGYLHSVLKDGKDPGIDNLITVCAVVGVSLPYILYGYDMSPATERIVRLLEENPAARDGVLQILTGQKSPA